MVTAASLGLARSREAGLSLLSGAILIASAMIMLRGDVAPEMILAVGVLGAVFAVPTAARIARDLGTTFRKVWVDPVVHFAATLGLIITTCGFAAYSGSLVLKAIAASFSLFLCAIHIFRPSASGSVFGYDTRSLGSALVMRIVDLINPFPRSEPFAWIGPCVISSIAGLGDLFIHLPLIAEIVNEAKRRGIEVRVALRPAHAAIGHACRWNVLRFDNSLEDFFKNPRSLRPAKLLRQIRDARAAKANLWIDLTGSAVSAIAIRLTGVRKVASRITRGGGSLVNFVLPHQLHENEYTNVQRVAATLGCQPDYSVFDPLRGKPIPGLENAVVLCLTTVCRWRNWPLENFLALIDRFMDVPFIATGLRSEVAQEESATLEAILQRPNVTSRMDKMSILELIRLIAHARAVVTNDTSTAHIANAFHKPGAVLFGPASPEKLAAPYGLKSFVDRTCPFHPCVQWNCSNQENWCMRKVQVEPVAEHLAAVLAMDTSYAATASTDRETPAIESSRLVH
jgi:ADP-heptose:LPS heptosyltransferase